jgi:hypothetical protein
MVFMKAEDAPPAMTPRRATELLRSKVGPDLELRWTKHARERLRQRGLVIGDVLHILRYGYVFDEAEPASSPGHMKYRMECKTPNSGGRTVAIVVIPSASNWIKLVTVMWKDE